MTESRPTPQYGEYASPEEQAKAMGAAAWPAPQPAEPAPVPRVRSSRDMVITVTLLGIGLVWVLLSIPGAADLPATLNRTYELQGYTGTYGPVELASTLGLLMNISSIVVWAITCAVSIAMLRRHRRAVYVPIIGAVVAGAIALALTLVAMLSDPGLIAYVNSLQA